MAGDSGINFFLIFLALSIFAGPAKSSPDDHRYAAGDPVPLFANKVGPYHNPSETYRYFDLPFCLPDQVIKKKETLGEVLNGDRLVNVRYNLNFKEDKTSEDVCWKTLSKDEVAKFRDAVKNDYYFQMYYDDLPVWGFIGKIKEKMGILNETRPRYYLFEHLQFDVLYNQNQIIEITAFNDPNYVLDITEDNETTAVFTYSVHWEETSVSFENRMDKYLKTSLLPQHLQLHWVSIFNSIVIIILLIGCLSVGVMRTLKNDLNKYSHGDDLEDNEEVGWKYLHGDVFRYPRYNPLLCAVLGSGTQLLTLVFCIFFLAFLGIFYPFNRGALHTSLVLIYALTSVIAGYTATSFYTQWGGIKWAGVMLLTGLLFPGPLFLTFSVLNTIAVSNSATAALPFGTIVVILLIWLLVAIPLLTVGCTFGKIYSSEFHAPCATKRIPTEIPPLLWYRRPLPQMFMAGVLPFSAIFLELHFIFTSLWGHKIYTIYSILFIVFIILIVVTAFLSIGLTYFQLAGEDHEWWWRSVLCGGSSSIFVYGYSCYFYSKSQMRGLMQTSFFFGYNACICYAFFLILGTVAFRATFMFVCHIYRAIKSE
ncbi:transmembrane 9 superfamily member 3-like [Tasmannia lanceolata]|uniref:transmembrane 9 superfamily member 3-like n=1 Tax=Tasmannia lanceolata TaxID=3420 RepID=UPI004062EF4F